MHERCSNPSPSERSTHCELFGQLAAYGSFSKQAEQPQRSAYQTPSVFGAYDQHAEKLAPAHTMYSISGHNTKFYCYAHQNFTGVFAGYHELACDVQRRQKAKGLMAAAPAVCCLGLLHMRPLQLWLRVLVICECLEALAPWMSTAF